VIKQILSQIILQPPCLLVGIGNILRGDDSFGPRVIHLLRNQTSLPLVDAGCAPENSLGPITRLAPRQIILIDAVTLDAPPGSLHWIEPDELAPGGISTHALSLELMVNFIRQSTQAQVHILGVVPVRLGLGNSFSPQVARAAEQLVSIIKKLAPADSQPLS